MEKRTILAILISIAFIVAWEKFVIKRYFPKKPVATVAAEQQENTSVDQTSMKEPAGIQPVETEEPVMVEADHTVTGTEMPDAVEQAETENSYVLENDVVRLTFTNRGAAIQSIQLKTFKNEEGELVELVNPVSILKGMLPFSSWENGNVNGRLFLVEQMGNRIVFSLGDHRKSFELLDGYLLHVDMTGCAGVQVSLGAGIEESEKSNSRYSTEDEVVWFDGSDVERVKKKKLAETEVPNSTIKWIGVEDKYFARVFLPGTDNIEYDLKRRRYMEEDKELGLSSVLISAGDSISGRAYLGPKHYDSMKELGDGLESIVNFGFFGIFAKWLFFGLKAVNNWVGNYGWTIVLLTVVIRILLFPLNQASLKSTRKMQTVQPKIKAIQQKYKKYGNDMSMKQKMNQEIAELYKKEGVNPLGGCLPMLLQMPIFFAFWSLLLNAIELRHAPFMLWIRDLSAHDPYYVLPILMGLSQLISQIITPSTGDVNQKRMMYMLPIVFTVILAYAPSGLILYWTTNNLFQIGQQLLINRRAAAVA